jgi:biopolymer transport protein ExbD
MKGWFVLLVIGLGLFSCSHESTSNKGSKFDQELPQETVNDVDDPFSDSIPRVEVRLNSKGDLLVNGKPTEKRQLQMAYDWAQNKYGGKAVVDFYVSKTTPYGDFMMVQSAIEEYNKKVRWFQAQSRFNMHFDKLTDAQQTALNEEFPIRVVEHKMK